MLSCWPGWQLTLQRLLDFAAAQHPAKSVLVQGKPRYELLHSSYANVTYLHALIYYYVKSVGAASVMLCCSDQTVQERNGDLKVWPCFPSKFTAMPAIHKGSTGEI